MVWAILGWAAWAQAMEPVGPPDGGTLVVRSTDPERGEVDLYLLHGEVEGVGYGDRLCATPCTVELAPGATRVRAGSLALGADLEVVADGTEQVWTVRPLRGRLLLLAAGSASLGTLTGGAGAVTTTVGAVARQPRTTRVGLGMMGGGAALWVGGYLMARGAVVRARPEDCGPGCREGRQARAEARSAGVSLR